MSSKSEMAASWAFRSRGLVGAVLGIAFGALVLTSAPMVPAVAWGHLPFEVLGWLAFIAGAVMRFWSTLYIGGRKTRVVVCDGPYSICRNPLYVGTFLVALSTALLLKSLTFGIGILIGAAFYALATVPAEERYLSATLGEAYDRYCRRVPRFWPRWSSFQTPAEITVDVHALRRESVRAARWVWLPVLLDTAGRMRFEAWWPHWLTLP
ncbi:MAG TPA: isoprenylcysteine carboxylmethyltransferase family protein [Pirellulales bacterium]|nr:isoprenylcysteine carboxylmethyltransferase family protein [Pirellulales bacterium]